MADQLKTNHPPIMQNGLAIVHRPLYGTCDNGLSWVQAGSTGYAVCPVCLTSPPDSEMGVVSE